MLKASSVSSIYSEKSSSVMKDTRFKNRKAAGVLEAKPKGATLSGVAEQSA